MNNICKLMMAGMILFTILPATAQDNRDFVSETLVVNSPLDSVWNAIKMERSNDQAHRKIISKLGSDYVVEETFDKIPVIGAVVCRYSVHEVPEKSVQYKMINSDKFVAFEGSWQLREVAVGQTSVTLTSFVDTGLHLPFAGKITRDSTKKIVDARINNISHLAANMVPSA